MLRRFRLAKYLAASMAASGTVFAQGFVLQGNTYTSLAPSAITDTTNAANIGSGTLPAGRLPALSGDVTSIAGSAATTVAKINGNTPGGSCLAHQFVGSVDSSGRPVCSQPAAADVSGLAAVATSGSATDLSAGTLAAARLPNPSANTLGGVQSLTGSANNFLTGISAAGVPQQAQPAFSNLSGSLTCAQRPALTGAVTTAAGSCATSISPGATLTDPINQETHISTGNFSATTTNLASITGLAQTLTAGGKYSCNGHVHFTTAPTTSNGVKVALATSDTLTVTQMNFTVQGFNGAAFMTSGTGSATALAATAIAATQAVTDLILNAEINVNASGTLQVQMAENAASGTIASNAGNARWNCHRAS